MRYGDKLSYGIHIPQDLLGLMTPKLILQPIVENAIYHGIKLSPTGGTITIGARRTEKLLILTVEDSGVGMTEEQTARLFEPKENTDRGIGVINVNNRIRMLFGKEYGLTIESELDEGTTVSICMPAVSYTEENRRILEKGHLFSRDESITGENGIKRNDNE